MSSSVLARAPIRATARHSPAQQARQLIEEAEAVPVPSDLAHAVPTETDIKEVRAHCADLLRRAILTMAATPDPERRFLAGYKSSMPETVMSPGDRQAAFGLDAVIEAAKEAREVQALRASRFKPTPRDNDRCLQVLSWLTWLGYRNDGRKGVKIITAWAHGVPMASARPNSQGRRRTRRRAAQAT